MTARGASRIDRCKRSNPDNRGVPARLADTSVAFVAPSAVGFYEKMGGRYLRDSAPSEWGRVLPVMGVDL
jgi:hypothetical protein